MKTRTIDSTSTRAVKVGHHFVVQFRSYPGPEVRSELESLGIRVLGYVPDNALMASSRTAPDLEGLDVAWVGSLAASDKLSPALAQAAAGCLPGDVASGCPIRGGTPDRAAPRVHGAGSSRPALRAFVSDRGF